MLLPALRARIEERDDVTSVRIDSRDVTPLETVALGTRIREVLRRGDPAMLGRDHMIDLVDEDGIVSVDETVLTAFPGSGDRERSQVERNVGHARPRSRR
jgi:hypothetical protein